MTDLPDFGCSDGSCPFASRLGMHTNGGCKCTYHLFPDMEQRRLVDAMLRRAREVATADEAKRASMRDTATERRVRILEIRRALGGQTDREIIDERKELRAELKRLELESIR